MNPISRRARAPRCETCGLVPMRRYEFAHGQDCRRWRVLAATSTSHHDVNQAWRQVLTTLVD